MGIYLGKKKKKEERSLDRLSQYKRPVCYAIFFDYREYKCKDCPFYGECWWAYDGKEREVRED